MTKENSRKNQSIDIDHQELQIHNDDKPKTVYNLHHKNEEKSVSYFKLQYRFANKCDYVLIIFATLGSLIAGASMPLISLLLGSAINNFGPNVNKAELSEKVVTLAINYILCGIGILLGSFMMSFFWSIVSKRLINKINIEYFQVLLQQEQGYFDQTQKNEHLVTKINHEIKVIENGIGIKVGQALMSISQFIASFIVGYITSWQLSLVLTAMLPLLGIGGWFMAKAMDQGQASNESYINAGAMSQEILKEIKTVASFANFEYEKDKYKGFIETAMQAGIKQGFKAGFGIGFIVFIVYNSYALAVGYGSYLIANNSLNKNTGQAFGAGEVITVLFSIIFGCFSLGQATPYINAIVCACQAAKSLFALLDRTPKIDLSKSTLKPDKSKLTGRIIFRNVYFAYPSKPDHFILNNLNLVIEPGQKVAIVGESGSGKSTILSLIERLYDPISGEILFDDYNIKTLDLTYLRNLIGYVPQQPVLLNTSIKENIIFGRDGIMDEDINIAIRNSKSDDFVTLKGIHFNVGAGGKMLSGGQKQRIAIARAIVNKPKILIFDEATSALDNICEQDVQKALDSVSKGLSSITVAHRITTIKNADKIICLNNGSVEDEGTHHELKKKSLFYIRLINEEEEEEEVIEDEEEFNEKNSNFDNINGKENDRDDMIIDMDEEKLENDENKKKSAIKEDDLGICGVGEDNFINPIESFKNNINTKNSSSGKKNNLHEINFNIGSDLINQDNTTNYQLQNGHGKKEKLGELHQEKVIDEKNINIENCQKRFNLEEDKIEKRSEQNFLAKKSENKEHLKDSYYLSQNLSKDEIDQINNLVREGAIHNKKKEGFLDHNDISGNFDEKNHKANDDCYSINASKNESVFEINDGDKNKAESLIGNSKEKTLKSNRSKGNLQILVPDQELENFNSNHKEGYLQINDDEFTHQYNQTSKTNIILKNNILNRGIFENNDLNLNFYKTNVNQYPISGNITNLSRISKGSKKGSGNDYKFNGNISKNLELQNYRSHENLSRNSFRKDSERKSVNSRNRKSEKKINTEDFGVNKNDQIAEIPKKVEEEEVKYSNEKFKKSRKRLFDNLKNQKKFLIGAGIAAALNGAVWPIYGILLADAIGTLSDENVHVVKSGGLNVALFFVALALSAALVLWMQNYFFYGIGEILNKEFRVKLFDKFLNLHIGFFENKLNNPLSVLARLSSYTSKIGGVATNVVGQMIQTSVTLILGITLALVYDWRLCLINLCFMPIIIGTYIIQFKVQKGSSNNNLELESEAASVLGETLCNTKTIFAYNMQKYIVNFYGNILKTINFKGIYKSGFLNGILYAISQFIVFGMYATLFYAGGKFFEQGDVTLKNMMRAILTILFSALGVGIAQAFVGDYSAAQKGIVGLYDFLDEKSLIDVEDSRKNGHVGSEFKGKIEFKNVYFYYPGMEKQPVFTELTFNIYPGQSAAFVGPSGSGKSTIISLIERFYDVCGGQILLDDKDIKLYNLVYLRKNIGTVLQEPGIFSRPIKENIRYGKLDATDEEIESAAKKAFIDNNLQNISSLGSGGEMQRVAIARAILKNPTILLLDEATSALDSNLEDHIKHSLKELMKGRTSIAVAHRLSTIINCDVIFYLENGSIKEQGTHDELIKKNGKYAILYNQSIE